ncbi:YhgE/Pip domain-containing protein [Paenibacillus hexagrammi]|uniref:YhgE/Pip domain-containing protein n=1 Tax=Paenibacillus hexagrammi TaxID=2908839 RepID=A0ABY3SEQ7_9BACL|nr:YhgE/Pip domain-containing protein [Paenibacillus sp. YPD9-1]UJF32474.1 YhgE/Pip domain-containing protein [Paenibacillus sp. YPD9-1]
MKNIWSIYASDWKHIFKVPTGIFLMVALAVLPSVYDWVNVISVWDPYAHTEGIKIAVTSEDEGAIVQDKTVNIGHDVMESLKTNRKLGWTFVDEEEAKRGVERGDYYASILIPPDFSRKLTSIASGSPQKPAVEYTVNEKINAVAPKITSSGVSALTAQINENFMKTVSETALQKFAEVGLQIEEELPTIRKVESGILTLEQSLPEVEQMGQKVLEVEAKLPEIHEKAQKIVELEQHIPQLEEAGKAILQVEAHWPQINEAAQQVVTLQKKLPEIQRAADRAAEIAQNFDKVDAALSSGIEKAQQAGEIVSTAQQALPKVEEIVEQGGAFAGAVQDFLIKNEAALDTLPSVVKMNLFLLQQTAQSVSQITQQLMDANLDPQKAVTALTFIQARLTGGAEVLTRTIDLLQRLNAYVSSPIITDSITRLGTLQSNMQEQIRTVGSIISAINSGTKPTQDLVERLNARAKEADALLGDVLSRYDTEIVPQMKQALERVKSAAQDASDTLQIAKSQLPNIKELLNDAQAGIQFGQEQLAALQQDLPQIRAKVQETTAALQDKLDQFTRAVNAAAAFVQTDLPKVGEKLHEASDFVRQDLPGLEQQLHQASDFVQNKLPEVEDGVHQVADLVRNDLPDLENAVHQAADRIRQVQGDGSLADLSRLLRGDIAEESDFLARPVQINEHRLYPIPNYGSAMAPFYAVLSLWVGSTLLISLLRIEVENPDNRYKGYHMYFGRLLTFLTLGLIQAVIMTLGDIWVLGTYVVHPVWFVLFAILVGSIFVTITYTLLSVFGNIGKGIAIVFMVFQFSSSGGTFPISTTSHFFQMLNPYMPFTYAISLLREAVGGILVATAVKDVLCLVAFIALSYLLALALKKPLSGLIRRSAENAKRTKIIS